MESKQIIDISTVARPIKFYNRQEKWERRKKEIMETNERLKKEVKELLIQIKKVES